MRQAAFVLVAACTSTPARPDFGQSRLEVTVNAADELEVQSIAPFAYKVRFGAGSTMPRELVVGNTNLLRADACPRESGIGVGLFPTYVVAAASDGSPELVGFHDVSLQGPAIARV